VPADFDEHYFTLRDDPAHQAEFRRICAFDIVANNTDRKSGHCLLGEDGRIGAIHNKLTFHAQFKLRTVIWDFAGEPLPREVADALCRLLDDELPEGVTGHIDAREQEALLERTRSLLAHARYPFDDTGHRYPWPLV